MPVRVRVRVRPQRVTSTARRWRILAVAFIITVLSPYFAYGRHCGTTLTLSTEPFSLDGLDEPASGCDWRPLRIEIDTSSLDANADPETCFPGIQTVKTFDCDREGRITPALRDKLVALVRDAADLMGRLLLVSECTPVTFNATTFPALSSRCGVYTSTTKTKTIQADMLIFLTARPQREKVLASGIDCVSLRLSGGRPIAGHVNISPRALLEDEHGGVDFTFGLVVHEMIHALCNFAKIGTAASGIRAPRVLDECGRHFGCTVAAVPLEDFPPGIGDNTHFEKAVFGPEVMTAHIDAHPVLSNLTLSVIEASGWFRVNYSYPAAATHAHAHAHAHASILRPFGFNRGEGCAALRPDQCATWRAPYACTEPGRHQCTADYRQLGECGLQTHSTPLPDSSAYRHYPDSRVGGAEEISNFCPVVVRYFEGDCSLPAPSTRALATLAGSEERGRASRCFESTLIRSENRYSFVWQLTGWPIPVRCHLAVCTDGGATLKIKIGGVWIDCAKPAPGNQSQSASRQVWTLPGYSGSIKCPSYPNAWPCGTHIDIDDSWPSLRSVVPPIGMGSGGEPITVIGERFRPGGMILVDGQPCAAATIVFVNASVYTAVQPYLDGHYTTGPVSVTYREASSGAGAGFNRTASIWDYQVTAVPLGAWQWALTHLLVPLLLLAATAAMCVSVRWEWSVLFGPGSGSGTASESYQSQSEPRSRRYIVNGREIPPPPNYPAPPPPGPRMRFRMTEIDETHEHVRESHGQGDVEAESDGDPDGNSSRQRPHARRRWVLVPDSRVWPMPMPMPPLPASVEPEAEVDDCVHGG